MMLRAGDRYALARAALPKIVGPYTSGLPDMAAYVNGEIGAPPSRKNGEAATKSACVMVVSDGAPLTTLNACTAHGLNGPDGK